MGTVCRIGLDIAKNYFQAHGVDKHGKDVFNKKLKRADVLPFFANLPSCLIGLEACGGAHYWARELAKLDTGHEVLLVSPRAVKPFVLNNKTDAADARAICEAVGRPSLRPVRVKTIEQQDIGAWHRIRERKVKERTALANQIRGLLQEYGIIVPQGIVHIRKHLPAIVENLENQLSLCARDYFSELYTEFVDLDQLIAKYESRILSLAKTHEACKRLLKIPGVGPLTATAIIAHVGNAADFKNGRDFSAYLGLTPREHSSGGRQHLLGITKRGNIYLRKLLIQGSRTVLQWSRIKASPQMGWRKKWLLALAERRGPFVAAVAQANKTARIIWAVLAHRVDYQSELDNAFAQ
jgi:transposase